MDRYVLMRQPTHSRAPNAWMVEHEEVGFDEDGDPIKDRDVICSGLPLREALDQIRLMEGNCG